MDSGLLDGHGMRAMQAKRSRTNGHQHQGSVHCAVQLTARWKRNRYNYAQATTAANQGAHRGLMMPTAGRGAPSDTRRPRTQRPEWAVNHMSKKAKAFWHSQRQRELREERRAKELVEQYHGQKRATAAARRRPATARRRPATARAGPSKGRASSSPQRPRPPPGRRRPHTARVPRTRPTDDGGGGGGGDNDGGGGGNGGNLLPGGADGLGGASTPPPPRPPRGGRRLTGLHAGSIELSDADKEQRSGDQVAHVLQSLLGSRRKLFGRAIQNAQDVFQAFDRDGSGRLDYGEFTQALKRLGLGLSAEQVGSLMRAMDADRDGSIDATEFVRHLEGAEARLTAAKRTRKLRARGGGGSAGTRSPGGAAAEDDDAGTGAGAGGQSEEALAPPPPPTPAEIVASMSKKQRKDALFKAMLTEDELMIVTLVNDGGVGLDIVRTNRLTAKHETPVEVAQTAGKLRAVAVVDSIVTQRRQQAVCQALVSKHEVLQSLSAMVEGKLSLERPPLAGEQNSRPAQLTNTLSLYSTERNAPL
jgi:hypothetical protein